MINDGGCDIVVAARCTTFVGANGPVKPSAVALSSNSISTSRCFESGAGTAIFEVIRKDAKAAKMSSFILEMRTSGTSV